MNKIVHGKLSGESVRDALMRLHPDTKRWVLIRSIDSTRSPEGIARILAFHGVRHEAIHGNVCLDSEGLGSALATDVFSGFDEVWVFLETPPAEFLGRIPSATSETTGFEEYVPKELLEAFERTKCLLVLGDGCGLNYATSDDQIAERLTSDVA